MTEHTKHIKTTLEALYRAAKEKMNAGSFRPYIGSEGYAVLLADGIERWFKTKRQDELMGFALDALFALHLSQDWDTIEESLRVLESIEENYEDFDDDEADDFEGEDEEDTTDAQESA